VSEGSEINPSEDPSSDLMGIPLQTLDWLPPLPFSDLEFLSKPTYIDYDAAIYVQEFHSSKFLTTFK
jgi:hypothetical protein